MCSSRRSSTQVQDPIPASISRMLRSYGGFTVRARPRSAATFMPPSASLKVWFVKAFCQLLTPHIQHGRMTLYAR